MRKKLKPAKMDGYKKMGDNTFFLKSTVFNFIYKEY